MGEPIRVVLDTSVFTNPDAAHELGASTAEALATLVALARDASDRVTLYMPPSIFAEVRTFIEPDELPEDFELVVALRAPDRHAVNVPGALLYELIDDIRSRIDRGLRVAEKAVRDAAPENVDRTINRLREQYRAALRSGLLDSREDVDLILLARELDAAVASADTAVVQWAETLGLRLVQAEGLRRLLASARG